MSSSSSSASSSQLPPGWTKHFNEQYQAFYYSHAEHGSRWEPPVEAAKASETTLLTDETAAAAASAGIAAKLKEATQTRIVADEEPLPGYAGGNSFENSIDNSSFDTAPGNRASVQSFAAVDQSEAAEASLRRLATADVVPASALARLSGSRAERVDAAGASAGASKSATPSPDLTLTQNQYAMSQPILAQSQPPYQQYQPQLYQQPIQHHQHYAAPMVASSSAAAAYYNNPYAASTVTAYGATAQPIRGDHDDELAYMSRLPAGSKRVSYSVKDQEAAYLNSALASEKSPEMVAKPLSEDEAYYSRLPPGAKRVSYSPVPASLSDDAKPLSANAPLGSYGTNNNNNNNYQPSPLGLNEQPQSRLRREEERLRRKEERRRYCCCFKTRKGCCLTVSLIVFLILAGLGVAAYFLWPRIPNVKISEPFLNPNTIPFTASGSLTTASAQQPFVVQINLAVNVNVFSPNYESITVNNVLFSGQLLGTDDKTPIPNANVNGQSGSVTFAANKDTQFMMPLTVMYSLSKPGLSGVASDPALSLFASKCTGSGSSIKMAYTVSINLAILSWTGYKPSFSGTTQFACPDISG
ncbi:hypothetical protein BDR26DRAFT_1005393, partial [Obelidium mucronatum]